MAIEANELTVFGVLLQQVSLKQGIKLWGEDAKASAIKEMQQMHDLSAFFPRDAQSLTREERIKVLRTLIFLKKKRDSSIKSRKCIDGSPQREYNAKDAQPPPL